MEEKNNKMNNNMCRADVVIWNLPSWHLNQALLQAVCRSEWSWQLSEESQRNELQMWVKLPLSHTLTNSESPGTPVDQSDWIFSLSGNNKDISIHSWIPLIARWGLFWLPFTLRNLKFVFSYFNWDYMHVCEH